MNRLIQFMSIRMLTLWLACGMGCAAQALDATPLGSLVIQDGGRKKPIDTFAKESLQKLSGRAVWKAPDGKRWPAVLWLADLSLGQESWETAPLLRCSFMPLKRALNLDSERSFFSFSELSTNQALERLVSEASEHRRAGSASDLSRVENGAIELSNKLQLFHELRSGSLLRIIPPQPQAGQAWFTLTDASRAYPEKKDTLIKLFQDMRSAYRKDDASGFGAAVAQLKAEARALSPSIYPVEDNISRELFYNQLHPFRWAWIAYLASFLAMLLLTRPGRAIGAGYWAAMALFAVGFLLQITGFTLRCWIAGRPPVTNMYEVMIFIAFGAVLFGLFFELKSRVRYFALAASATSVVSLILADNLPTVLNPAIQPLVPVLRSNYWLTVHVLTITLGYAAFLLAMGIGHIVLGYCLLKPGDTKKIDELTQFNYRSLQMGVLLLTAGTILGGVWANVSWGRFWGWDPKETWALIALLCYLVVLHGRYSGWLGNFALNIASVVCFQAIIMAAYGVNYVLGKGLHSYGFGVGGEWAVGSYVAAELLLVSLAGWRYKQLHRVETTDAPAASAGRVKTVVAS
jgi:cytochrome c-type biogenesis protein CcsB